MKSNKLVLVRHGQSIWNEKNLFTGWRDVGLTDKGVEEAKKAGLLLKEANVNFDVMFTSSLERAKKTGDIILSCMDQRSIEVVSDSALNERDYGELTGMNKDEARKNFGESQVQIWRRSYDMPPPGGESLKNTFERVLPYFNKYIHPRLSNGESILITAHGNSLRSLVKHLEEISEEKIVKLEIATGEPIFYEFINGKVQKIVR
ncbi:MAG: 2,3-bisphosphoglycerate-dependent phosphoglycerate mutase [Gammaproteobacteria bacterium]|jgi:2,3-bisphosphoglycerate-dependent phosphoglycerate mutase|nr:2,3-bisphosphoglycerate-dependent phosphoglycerate mutase [Gammaproteobacteria bacterium]MAO99041.1 2,3-bisphosphoglycerate-dependent phosphoglycerate mutase [Gammaproteobacteria bacterium]|tara:strand:- start:4494 stop:5105 length:612 start_codon:yes stop_codon:yes gene_type:complete